jgi:hypothetical protein
MKAAAAPAMAVTEEGSAMARTTTRSAKKAAAKRRTTKAKRESRLFAVKLRDVPLTQRQASRIASQIRAVTTKELLRMDFLIEQLEIPPRGIVTAAGCKACNGCG